LYNNFPLLDQNSTPLLGNTSSGDLVQFILTGPDNAINPPDQYGNLTGDDTLLFTTHVGYGSPWFVDQGYLDMFPIPYSSNLVSKSVYVRFWNSPTAAPGTYFGNSSIFPLPAGDPFDQAALDFVPLDSSPRITDISTRTLDTVGDGIPDWWRQEYFGGTGTTTDALSCATCGTEGTGQNNLFKYIAGLDPTNPASIFMLKIAKVTGQPTQKNLLFSPIATGRTYTVEFRTNLVSGGYSALPDFSGPQTNGNQVTITDLTATQSSKFYRVRISLP
jgi:hypothetical protein